MVLLFKLAHSLNSFGALEERKTSSHCGQHAGSRDTESRARVGDVLWMMVVYVEMTE